MLFFNVHKQTESKCDSNTNYILNILKILFCCIIIKIEDLNIIIITINSRSSSSIILR